MNVPAKSSHAYVLRMKDRWNQRASADAFHYVETTYWDGDQEKFFRMGEERAQLIVDPVLTRLQCAASEATALEIGCGLGRFSRALATRFGRVVGIDVSDEMIRQAQELHPRDRFQNLSFLTSDGVSCANLSDGSADFVFSYEVIQHMPSYDVIASTMRDVRRVLKPTGFGLLHVHIGSPPPLLSRHRIGSYIPGWLRRILGLDPLAGDATFRGTPPLTTDQIASLCWQAGLKLSGTRVDPTHESGSRIFLVVDPVQR